MSTGVRLGREPEGSRVLTVGQWLCLVSMVFASGDIWPIISAGFTFRLSQLCVILLLLMLPVMLRRATLRLFPGWSWLGAFMIWIAACLPLSQYPERSLAYVLFALLDGLQILIFIQYFRTETQLRKLALYFLISFLALALFGILQFALGTVGISVLTQQWWIAGLFPRVNGLSYEPSYYATYLLPGWVFADCLLASRSEVVGRRLQYFCFATITVALVLSSSRLGWGMMLAWFALKAVGKILRRLRSGYFTKPELARYVSICVLVGLGTVGWISQAERIDDLLGGVAFLGNGVTLPGEGGGSTETRLSELQMTWNAFLDNPITGTGIGALPVSIGAQKGESVLTLEDAKVNEGMSIFAELLASTGIIGGLLFVGFGIALAGWGFLRIQSMPLWRRNLLVSAGWAVVWILLALQFNQNFLRVYLFVDIAMLACCICATRDIKLTELTPVRSAANGIKSLA